MAVAILVLVIISIFAVGIASITFQPAIFELAYESDFWEDSLNVDPRLQQLRDTLYNASIAIPVLMIGIIVVWALLAVSRRDDI